MDARIITVRKVVGNPSEVSERKYHRSRTEEMPDARSNPERSLSEMPPPLAAGPSSAGSGTPVRPAFFLWAENQKKEPASHRLLFTFRRTQFGLLGVGRYRKEVFRFGKPRFKQSLLFVVIFVFHHLPEVYDPFADFARHGFVRHVLYALGFRRSRPFSRLRRFWKRRGFRYACETLRRKHWKPSCRLSSRRASGWTSP